MRRTSSSALRWSSVALLVGATLLTNVTMASAGAKPASDLVPAGAHVLYWSYPLPVSNQVLTGTKTVRNPRIIANVRALINSLPVSDTTHRVCPDDMMLPYSVSFAVSSTAKPFTKVVFQLGGCPEATVYQHGVPIAPTLGGPHLASTYAKIQKLISPQGQPLA